MQRSKKALIAAATAAIAQFSIYSATQAATFTWDGGGANDNLNTGANWIGDVTPLPADVAIFTGNVRTSPIVDIPTTLLGVQFDALAEAFTLGGASTLTLGASPSTAGTIVNNSLFTQTFNAPVAFYAGSINAASASLVFNGPINIGNGGTVSANAITVTGTFSTTINGALTSAIQTGSTALNKTGAGTLFVNGDNSALAGNVSVSGGALQINNGNALGSTGTIIMSAAPAGGGTGQGALELTNNITINKNVQMNGRDNTSAAHIRNISGNNTIANLHGTSGGAFHVIESAGGHLTINNYTQFSVPSARTLAVIGAGNGQINAWAPNESFAHNLVKQGTGQWTLGSGMSGNGSFNNATINGGTLILQGGLGARVTGNTTITTGGTLVVQSPDGTSGEVGNGLTPTSITIQNGGTFDASTFSTYSLQIGQTLIGGGTMKVGTLTAFGDNPIRVGNSGAAGSIGTFNVIGNLSLSNQFAGANGGLHFDVSDDTTVGGGVNDLIQIDGGLSIDNSGGPINVYLNPVTASFATGTYRLIEFTGGSVLNPADFNLQGFNASQTRQTAVITTAAGQVNLMVSGNVGDLVWVGDGSGNVWDVGGAPNWTGATPNTFLQGDNVTFNNTSNNTTINLSAAVLPGMINFDNDAAHNYVITGSGTLQSGVLTKNGAGTVTIANTGTNSLTGAITINQGTLQVGMGGAEGSLGGGTIINNANLVFNRSDSITIPNLIEGNGQIVQRGVGAAALVLSNGSSTFTGPILIESGVIQYSNGAALGAGTSGITVQTSGQLFSTANTTIEKPLTLNGEGPVANDGALRVGGATTATFNGAINLASAATIKIDGGATALLNGPITGNNVNLTFAGDAAGAAVVNGTLSLGSGALIKGGAGGVAILATPNISYTGGTSITNGTLQLGAGSIAVDLPAGPISTTTPGALSFGSDQAINFTRTVTGNGVIASGAGGGTTTLSGDLSGFTGVFAASPSPNQATNITSTLIVSAASNATGVLITDPAINGVGDSIVRLAHTNALSNGATINVQTGQDSGFGRLELGNGVAINAGTVNLHQRNNLTPAILATDGAASLTGNLYLQNGGSLTNLSVAAGATFLVSGTAQAGDLAPSARHLRLDGEGVGTFSAEIQAAAQPVNVIKAGTGTWTMTGANNTAGTLRVEAGRLVLGPAMHTNIFSGTGVDIAGGRLALDYSGGASVASQVQAILDAGYDLDPKFSSGQIRTTNPFVEGRGLGWIDDTDADQVLVAYTYFGDADLDGDVDGIDVGAWAQNFTGELGGAGTSVWAQGDWDYDGDVDGIDVGLWAQNFTGELGGTGLSSVVVQVDDLGSPAAAILQGLGVTVVPEPASLGLLGLGLAGIAARRRRR